VTDARATWPVITQDTGFDNVLTGKACRLRAWTTFSPPVDVIESDFAGHCRSARKLAAEGFEAGPRDRLADGAPRGSIDRRPAGLRDRPRWWKDLSAVQHHAAVT
jgi:hypothetical protein